jgi:hypothetical protein
MTEPPLLHHITLPNPWTDATFYFIFLFPIISSLFLTYISICFLFISYLPLICADLLHHTITPLQLLPDN